MQIDSMTIFSTGLSLKGARKTERKTKDDRQNRGITKDITKNRDQRKECYLRLFNILMQFTRQYLE